MTKKTTPLAVSDLENLMTASGAKTEDFNKLLSKYSQLRQRAIQNNFALEKRILKINDSFKARFHKKAYDNINDCGNWLLFRNYIKTGKFKLANANFCKKYLLCPLCGLRRGARYVRKYLRLLKALVKENPGYKLSLITLTVKNRDSFIDVFEHLRGAQQGLGQRIRNSRKGKYKNSEFRKMLGIVGSYEIKRGKGSGKWHPHIHMLVLHEEDFLFKKYKNGRTVTRLDKIKNKNVPIPLIQDEWLDITGDSYIVDITPVEDVLKGFFEVFSYALKFSTMTPEDTVYVWEYLQNRRLIFSSGVFYGADIDMDKEDLLDDGLTEDEPYQEIMCSYFFNSGYIVTSITDISKDERYERKQDSILKQFKVEFKFK